ncbi:MAG: hypothetical protein JSV19_11900 [Phycisphaerales bacterium]|nr:MAG: hypothetical protein JSV19_11900 [Phycisphaerales bacterium]
MKKALLAAAWAALVGGVANAADLTLDIQYDSTTEQIEIYANVTGQTGDQMGLALLGVDLECNSAEALSLLTPDLTSAVTELNRDAGLTNPGVNAYFGTVSGLNLLQVGGAQNTIGYDGTAGPTYPTGTVNTMLAMGVPYRVAAFDVNVGGLIGTEVYTLNNPFANVIDDPGAGPVYAVSPITSVGYTNQTVSFDHGPHFLGVADSIGTVCNLTLSSGDTEPRAGGIRQLNFLFDRPPGSTPVFLYWDNSGVCPPTPPVYVPYSGASAMACSPLGNELQCTFTPALEDDSSYEFWFVVCGSPAFRVRSLIGDVYADGVVDGSDRSTIHANWGLSTCSADVFEDGVVDGSDRSTVHANWGNCAP